MKIDDILALDDFKQVLDILTRDSNEKRNREEYRAEYNGERTRRLTSVGYRENKQVDIYSETEVEIDKDGNEIPKKIGTKTIVVAKLPSNAPKRIVRISAAFLFGGEMNIAFAENSDASQLFHETFESKLKMKSVLNQFARTVKIETKSALIFYPRDGKDDNGNLITEIKVKVLSLKNGDFFPHFDEYGDMDAFTRTYKAIHTDGKEHDFIWIQTAMQEYLYVDISGNWELVQGYPQTNYAGKITVVYAEQDKPEWDDVAKSIDMYENRISRMIDTNDYFGDPILKNFGESALPSKNTVGKQITFPKYVDPETGQELHGDAEYLVWQQSIDSIKLELETLRNEIYAGSSTPDLSFENMKGIGSLSGTAIKLMFIEAFIKAAEGMEIFGPVIQRSVSVVLALMSNVTNKQYKEQLKAAKPEVTFGSLLPGNIMEMIETLVKAKEINSQETLVSHSPFTKNVEEEVERIKAEKQAESERNQLIGMTF